MRIILTALILILAFCLPPVPAQEAEDHAAFAARVFQAMKDGVEKKDAALFFRNFSPDCREDDGSLFLTEEKPRITKMFEENETLSFEYTLLSVEEDGEQTKISARWKIVADQGGDEETAQLWIDEAGKIVRIALDDDAEDEMIHPATTPSSPRPEEEGAPPPEGLPTDLRPDDGSGPPQGSDVEPGSETLDLGDPDSIPDTAQPKNDKIDYGDLR